MEVGDFLGDSVLLVRTEVKRSWALLTANVLGNFAKYMLFAAAYNIQKKGKKKIPCLALNGLKELTNTAQANTKTLGSYRNWNKKGC